MTVLLQQPVQEFYAALATFVRVLNKRAAAIEKAREDATDGD